MSAKKVHFLQEQSITSCAAREYIYLYVYRQYAQWASDEDSEILIRQLLDAIRQFADLQSTVALPLMSGDVRAITAPKPYADPRFLDTLHEPGGAVRARSDFYVVRATDCRWMMPTGLIA